MAQTGWMDFEGYREQVNTLGQRAHNVNAGVAREARVGCRAYNNRRYSQLWRACAIVSSELG
jgi:hypothetical protein